MKKKSSEESHHHPDHSQFKGRLKRVQGQIEGIARMIDEQRYCNDILIQLRAAAKALESIEAGILETHLQGCVKTAMRSKDENAAAEKIEEIMKLLKR